MSITYASLLHCTHTGLPRTRPLGASTIRNRSTRGPRLHLFQTHTFLTHTHAHNMQEPMHAQIVGTHRPTHKNAHAHTHARTERAGAHACTDIGMHRPTHKHAHAHMRAHTPVHTHTHAPPGRPSAACRNEACTHRTAGTHPTWCLQTAAHPPPGANSAGTARRQGAARLRHLEQRSLI